VKILTLEEIPHVLQHKNVTDVALRKGNVHKRYACSITTLDCGDVEVERPPTNESERAQAHILTLPQAK
jgi:hypothetical protein